MRLWHKDLISVLPRQQLLAQYRECVCIARNIVVNGTPNHLLVNKVMDYPKWHFKQYTLEVILEMEKRRYKVNRQRFFRWFDQWKDGNVKTHDITHDELFDGWHDNRYLVQCYFNFSEKYDCGGISDMAMNVILHYMINRCGVILVQFNDNVRRENNDKRSKKKSSGKV